MIKESPQKLSQNTKRSELPPLFSEEQITQLEPHIYYPSHFYNSVTGLKQGRVFINDFRAGAINPCSVKFLGQMRLGMRPKRGGKYRAVITGAELQRIFREGRQFGRFPITPQH